MDDPVVQSRFLETAEAIRRLWFDDLMVIAGFCDYGNLQDLSWGLGHAQSTLGDEIAVQMHTNRILPTLRTLASTNQNMLRFRDNLNLIFPRGPPDDVQLGRKRYTLRCAAPLTVILWALAFEADEWQGLPIHGLDALVEKMGRLTFNDALPDHLMRAACELLHAGRGEYATTAFFEFLEAWEVVHRWDRRHVAARRVRFAS